MTAKLTHSSTGHKISVDEGSVDFWKAAGYRADQAPTPKKAPAKKSSKK